MTQSPNPYMDRKSPTLTCPRHVSEHWQTARLKAYVGNINEPTRTMKPGEAFIALEHVEGWTGKVRAADTEIDFDSQAKRFQNGDVLFGKLRPYLAKVTSPEKSGVCVGEFLVLRPNKDFIIPPFLERLLRSKPIIDAVDASTFGAKMPRADWQFIGNMMHSLPPLPEQAAIVRYLDGADQQIQRYIAAKERLIALLEEERQAVIHQAVTRGLDPNVRLKPSSVEWLGDVPEHWEVMPLKRAFVSMDYGISDSGSQTGGVRLLTMGNIKDGSVTVPSTGGVTAVDQSLLLGKNDLLFNRTNSAELVAKVGLFSGHDSPVTFASYLVRMRSRSSNEPEYLNMALNETTFLAQARREAVPSLHQSNLNPTRYGRIQISLPPKEEQKTILTALAEKTNGLKTSMELAHRQIELIEEYRTRLIADVVTGKIDVREAKP